MCSGMTDIWTSALHTASLLNFASAFVLFLGAAAFFAVFSERQPAKSGQKTANPKAKVHGEKLQALHESIKQINADRERALAVIAAMGR